MDVPEPDPASQLLLAGGGSSGITSSASLFPLEVPGGHLNWVSSEEAAALLGLCLCLFHQEQEAASHLTF